MFEILGAHGINPVTAFILILLLWQEFRMYKALTTKQQHGDSVKFAELSNQIKGFETTLAEFKQESAVQTSKMKLIEQDIESLKTNMNNITNGQQSILYQNQEISKNLGFMFVGLQMIADKHGIDLKKYLMEA